jgi:hypothetical protein
MCEGLECSTIYCCGTARGRHVVPDVIGPALVDYVAGPRSSLAAFENQRCFALQETDDVD